MDNIPYFEELNFRVFQRSSIFAFFSEFGETAKFMHHENFLNLLLAATSSSRWALAGLLFKEIPSSSISTANSDIAKVLELKDSKK